MNEPARANGASPSGEGRSESARSEGSSPVAEPASTADASGAEARRERGRLARRASVVAAGTLGSRVLGLVRDQVIAAVFERGITDAFFVAFTLPNVLRQVLAEGAVQSAVLPVLSQTREREGDAAARSFFASIRGVSLTLLGLVSVLGVVFAPQLVSLFAEGYRQLPGQFERTVELTRWVFPYIFCMGTAALGMAALNTYHRFAVAAFAPALLNVAFVVCSFGLPAALGARGLDPALALAFAVLLGGVLQVVAQWPSLRAIGYLNRPELNLAHPGVREVARRMVPVLFGMGVYYVDVLVARRMLSGLGLGAQSYFSWALRLCDFPQGIFVMALQTAALPSLSRFASRGDHEEFSHTFAFGLRLALFVALPATALCVALAEPIVVVLFQRGAFDPESARETGRALVAQGSGIWLVAAVRQLVSAYYALGDTRRPAIVAALDLVAFIVAALVLRGPLGHVGIGAAVAFSSGVQALLLWGGLRGRLLASDRAAIRRSVLAHVGCSALAGLCAAGLSHTWGGQLGAFGTVTLGGALFVGVFLLSARLGKSSELGLLSEMLGKRLGRRSTGA